MGFIATNEKDDSPLPEGYEIKVVEFPDGDLRLVAASSAGNWLGPSRLMHQSYRAVGDAWRHFHRGVR